MALLRGVGILGTMMSTAVQLINLVFSTTWILARTRRSLLLSLTLFAFNSALLRIWEGHIYGRHGALGNLLAGSVCLLYTPGTHHKVRWLRLFQRSIPFVVVILCLCAVRCIVDAIGAACISLLFVMLSMDSPSDHKLVGTIWCSVNGIMFGCEGYPGLALWCEGAALASSVVLFSMAKAASKAEMASLRDQVEQLKRNNRTLKDKLSEARRSSGELSGAASDEALTSLSSPAQRWRSNKRSARSKLEACDEFREHRRGSTPWPRRGDSARRSDGPRCLRFSPRLQCSGACRASSRGGASPAALVPQFAQLTPTAVLTRRIERSCGQVRRQPLAARALGERGAARRPAWPPLPR